MSSMYVSHKKHGAKINKICEKTNIEGKKVYREGVFFAGSELEVSEFTASLDRRTPFFLHSFWFAAK